MAQKIVIAASVSVRPEKREVFLAFAAEVVRASRAEGGNISYTLYEEPSVAGSFLFFEEWKDQAAVDIHFGTAHFKKLGSVLGECAGGAPQIKMFTVSSER